MSSIAALDGFQVDMNLTASISDEAVQPLFTISNTPGVPTDASETVTLQGNGVDVVFAEIDICDIALSTLFTNNTSNVQTKARELLSATHAYFGSIWDDHSGYNDAPWHLAALSGKDSIDALSGIINAKYALESAINTAVSFTVSGTMKNLNNAYSMTDNGDGLLSVSNGSADLFSFSNDATIEFGSLPMIGHIEDALDASSWASAHGDLKNLMSAIVDTKTTELQDLSGLVDTSTSDKDAFLSFIIPSFNITFSITYGGSTVNGTSRTVAASAISPTTLASNNISAGSFGDGGEYTAGVTLVDSTAIEGVSFSADTATNTASRTVNVTSYTISITDPDVSATLSDGDVTQTGTFSDDDVSNASFVVYFTKTASATGATFSADVNNANTSVTARSNTFKYTGVDESKVTSGQCTVRLDYPAGYDPVSKRGNYTDGDE